MQILSYSHAVPSPFRILSCSPNLPFIRVFMWAKQECKQEGQKQGMAFQEVFEWYLLSDIMQIWSNRLPLWLARTASPLAHNYSQKIANRFLSFNCHLLCGWLLCVPSCLASHQRETYGSPSKTFQNEGKEEERIKSRSKKRFVQGKRKKSERKQLWGWARRRKPVSGLEGISWQRTQGINIA